MFSRGCAQSAKCGAGGWSDGTGEQGLVSSRGCAPCKLWFGEGCRQWRCPAGAAVLAKCGSVHCPACRRLLHRRFPCASACLACVLVTPPSPSANPAPRACFSARQRRVPCMCASLASTLEWTATCAGALSLPAAGRTVAAACCIGAAACCIGAAACCSLHLSSRQRTAASAGAGAPPRWAPMLLHPAWRLRCNIYAWLLMWWRSTATLRSSPCSLHSAC